MNAAGGAFGAPSLDSTSAFSSASAGVLGIDYHFDSPASFAFLAARGLRLVRIEFRWERVQRSPGGPLDATELAHLRAAVDSAGAAGLRVVLDLHNYGAFYLQDGVRGSRAAVGSPSLPLGSLADLWRRLSEEFEDHEAVEAYGLMNEPVGLAPLGSLTPPQVWERASQGALDAIRERGDETLVTVPGYFYSGVQDWAKLHPSAWIDDPADRIRYEAHHYWDADHSSRYEQSYADLAAAL